MRTPTPLIVFTFALTTTLLPASTAQLAQQLSDGQIQVPTSLAPLTTPPAPKVAVPTSSPPLPAPIESATTLALPPSSTAAAPPPPTTPLAVETTAPVSPPPTPPNEAAETLPSPPPVTANINVTYTTTSSCTCTGTGSGSGALVAGNTTVPTVPSVPSVAAPASTEEGPSEAGTTAPTAASNVGTRVGWGGVGGAVVGVGVVLLWNL